MTILFLHVPKTAGSFIDSQIQKSEYKSKHAISSKPAIEKVIHENLDYICGHFIYNDIEIYLENQENKLVSLVRNPIDRLFSEANYHIEILSRGKDFFEKHGSAAQALIRKTYICIKNERDNSNSAEINHLYSFGLDNYLSKRILPSELQNQCKNETPHHCAKKIKALLNNYSFIQTVENNGVENLIDYISKNSGIKFSSSSKATAFRNKSNNYINPSLHLTTIAEKLRKDCDLSNLLYLIIFGISINFFKDKTWGYINEYASAKFISESNYLKITSCDKLPNIDFVALQ